MLNKISSQDASSLLKTAGATIRTLKQECDRLKAENDAFRKEARVKDIARSMEEKGLNSELSTEEKVAQLREAPNLDVIEEAVKIASKQSVGIGSVTRDGEGPGGGGLSPFEQFILTGEAE